MSRERLDKRLVSENAKLSRSVLQRLITDGKVYVNDKVTLDPNTRVSSEDNVTLEINQVDDAVVDEYEVEIMYEDEDCVVINKPEGMLTHSKGALIEEQTVASWLSKKQNWNTNNNRKGIVHRLDRSTSGVMICAKSEESQSWLQKQFSQRKTKKTYLAVVSGEISPKEAVIDMPIARNPKKPQRFRVDGKGKSAITHYVTEGFIEADNGLMLSLLRVTPTTGRTHQLRVHFAHLRHPILGDTFYNGSSSDRLYLHALSLELTLPSKKRMRFNAKKPKSFDNPKV